MPHVLPVKLILKTKVAAVAVTDADLKLFAKIDLTDDDALVTDLNAAATEYITDTMEKSFINETFEEFYDAFPLSGCPINLSRSRLSSVVSIKYIDTDGVVITLATTEYKIDDKIEPPQIREAFGKTWPSTRSEHNAVTVEYVTGEGAAAANIPEKFVTIIKQLFVHWYVHREPMKDKQYREIPIHVSALIDKYRIQRQG